MLAWLVAAGAAEATCTTLQKPNVAMASTIGLVGGAQLPPAALAAAIQAWGTCANYGTGFPSLLMGDTGTRTVAIEFFPERVGAARCGDFSARTVRLYGFVDTGAGAVRPCPAVALNLVHEIGHVLGLSDAAPGRACQHHAMASINPNNAYRRWVTTEECQAVGQRWITPAEWAQVSDRSLVTALVVAGGQ